MYNYKLNTWLNINIVIWENAIKIFKNVETLIIVEKKY